MNQRKQLFGCLKDIWQSVEEHLPIYSLFFYLFFKQEIIIHLNAYNKN